MWADEEAALNSGQKDWIFISDAHLNGREPEEMEEFLRFLHSQKERISHLVILGDLFEFFFGFKGSSSFPFPDYLPVLQGLRQLYEQGIQIKYIEGNHDFSLHYFFEDWLGMRVEVYSEGVEMNLGERRAFLSHGDLSNPKLLGYRIFRRGLKNRFTFQLIQFVGPWISRWVAQRMSARSYRRYHRNRGGDPPLEFRTFAHQKFLEGFEIVILGHSHFPEKVEENVEGRRCLYVNTGDWVDHRSYLRFSPPETFELNQWKGDESSTLIVRRKNGS